jgi:hypothetical protein
MAPDLDVFTRIAQKLINVGIPVVIGMPFLIFDDTAVLFSKAFYRALIRHRSIDQAVAEARRAIMVRKGVDKIDWATPVLFMSNPVGLTFSSAFELTRT